MSARLSAAAGRVAYVVVVGRAAVEMVAMWKVAVGTATAGRMAVDSVAMRFDGFRKSKVQM